MTVDATDIVLIHQLLGEYGHAIDAGDWNRFAGLFVADAVLDYTAARAPAVFHGVEEILDYFRPANHPAAHHVTNIVVTEVGGKVRVHSKFLAPFTRPSHDPVRWYGGDYHDVVVKGADDAWRFASKTCIPHWQFASMPFDDSAMPAHRRTF